MKLRIPKNSGWSIRKRLAYYSRLNERNGCIEFQGTLSHGYGVLRLMGRNYLAHRLAYEIANEPIVDDNLCVLHACDNPRCINKEHLFLGTRTDNSIDKMAKGRHDCGKILAVAQVREIRELIQNGTTLSNTQLGELYGVHRRTINHVRRGTRWKNI